MEINLLVYVLVCVTCLLVGYGIGIISSGIKIYHLDKIPGEKQEYNVSLANEIPPEQRNYYDNTYGRNDF